MPTRCLQTRFLPTILTKKNLNGPNAVVFQGWPMYAQLLIDLFKYLAPFLRNVELNKPMQILYKVSFFSFL